MIQIYLLSEYYKKYSGQIKIIVGFRFPTDLSKI